ncbi:MAG: outer membrane beta-barrel protein [candidate division KSB1 bacterium]|nr:outer membrane beta-barrel protein [candidate division KSB1 bacterium]
MNLKKMTLFFLSAVFLLNTGLWAQAGWSQSKFGIGVNVGVQHVYSDLQPAGLGLASEASLRYFMSQRLNFALSAGYGELNDGFFERHFYTTVLNADLKGQFNLLTSRFRPFVSAGVGITNFTFNIADDTFYRVCV